MSLRRAVALVVLAAAIAMWHAETNQLSGTFLGPLALIFSPIIGLLAIAVLLFNLPILGPRYEDSGYDLLSEKQGNAIGAYVLYLLGFLMLFAGFRGLYRGQMPALHSGPDFTYAKDPAEYLLTFFGWVIGGVGLAVVDSLAKNTARAKNKRRGRTQAPVEKVRK